MALGKAVLRVLLIHAFGDVPNGHEGCKFFTFPRGVRELLLGSGVFGRGESLGVRVLVVQTKWVSLVGEKMSICLALEMVFEINFPVTM